MTLSPGERLVVDASVAVKWVVRESDSERAITLLDHELVAPDLLFSECANILWRKTRNGNLNIEEARIAANAIEQAELTVVSTRACLARGLAIATELSHPAYDAIYLAVAEAFALRLISADQRLIRKLDQHGGRFADTVVPLADIPPQGYSA